jgi:hypothetical protein
MEKVFDLHVHYTFDIPLCETVKIFQEEYQATGTEKFCFLSLPHHSDGKTVEFDATQNVKGLFLKSVFAQNAYAFAGLEHPTEHTDKQAVSDSFVSQAKRYLSVGYDGIKMLEGYPSLLKAWNLPLDDSVYDAFYRFAEERHVPIILHAGNPKENWDIRSASPYAIAAGRVYDDSYPSKEAITEQVFRVMEKHPALTLILAHFGFMSDSMETAERFLSYPNTAFDVTPGGEQLIQMQKEWERWLPFWKKHQGRIFYGTDFYAFPKDENWEVAFQRRPKFLRNFLETDGEHEYLDERFCGVNLPKSLRDKIYRENFLRLLGTPKKIDTIFLKEETHRLLLLESHTSPNAKSDLEYILQSLTSSI